jgi:hypothetical protein
MNQGSANSIVERAIKVVKLEPRVFDIIARDPTATQQAAIVVGVVALASAIGGAADGISGFIVGLIGAILGWLIFAGLAWFFGTNIFGTPTTVTNWESLLRTLGYAQAPNVLAIFGIIPLIGWIPALIGSIWAIVTAVVAIRETLDFSTGRAVITAIVAWIATAIVAIILGLLFNVTIVF